MSASPSLPNGWQTVRLGDAGSWRGGGTPSKAEPRFWTDGAVPWVSPKDMKSLRIAGSEDRITEAALEETNVKTYPVGTVLIVIRSGILSRTLPVGVAQVSGTMNQDLKGIVPTRDVDPMFLAYQLIACERDVLNQCSKHGTTVASIDTERLHDFTIRVAPLEEQRRIVAKIEELFSDLDAGVAALTRVRANLKRYRASVLKAAVEGRLTAAWRAAHPDTEPADKLLARILAERRAKWEEEQLRKYAEKGKEPPKGWKEKYKPAPRPANRIPADLPQTWAWAALAEVATFQNGRPFPSSEYSDSGIPLLRPGNLFPDGSVRWTGKNTKLLPEEYAERCPDLLVGGHEMIMNLTAQSLKDEFLGRVCMTNTTDRCLLNQRLARLTPVFGMTPRFTLWLLKSQVFRRFVDGLNSGSLIQHMFTSQLEDFCFALPPESEQAEIVAEIDRRLSVVDAIETEVEHALQRADRLHQAILKRAFEGRLVPQEATDQRHSVRLGESRPVDYEGVAATEPARQRSVTA